jgi:hypothetical protein
VSPFRRSFLVWALVVAAAWVAFNLPYKKGLLGEWAGFPWTYYGGFVGFDGWALVGDIEVGALVTAAVAAACAWSRTRRPVEPPPSRRTSAVSLHVSGEASHPSHHFAASRGSRGETAVDRSRAAAALLGGVGLLLFSGFLLLWTYAWCLTDPSDPFYYFNKLRMMFNLPDPGVVTWLGLALFLDGLVLVVYGIVNAVRPPRSSARNDS